MQARKIEVERFTLIYAVLASLLVFLINMIGASKNGSGYLKDFQGIGMVLFSTATVYLMLVWASRDRPAVSRNAAAPADQALGVPLPAPETSVPGKDLEAVLERWGQALELRHHETTSHVRRVADTAVQLGRELGMAESELEHLRRGALLHDIGTLSLPDSILLKNGPLTDDERQVMQQHPEIACELLAGISFLEPALEIPRCHHERWDGDGYPRGLKGEEIPLAARIFAVVDVWDALTSDRPYRKALPSRAAVTFIRSQAGAQFDPQAVDAFWKLSSMSSISRMDE